MYALKDMYNNVEHFQTDPRVYLMDLNIKDFTSLNPFSHVYLFQIGMPDVVIDHIFYSTKSKGITKEGGIIELKKPLSDHKPVWADIVFPQALKDAK